ncbi:DNA-binding protein [Rugamonas fusca]|nr:DNA-binding protein [Rugamonas fusca]
MPRQEVTLDEVTAAATSLQDEGRDVSLDTVREVLGGGSAPTIHRHLAAWRGRAALAQAERDMADLIKAGEELEGERDELQAQLASVTIARDQALALSAEQTEDIERLRAELRDARQVATDALVGKAKDQLAIDGKDAQLADLRQQIERNVAASAALSDARLKAEMELVGAVTARDNFEADAKELRSKLDKSNAERIALRAELEALKASA